MASTPHGYFATTYALLEDPSWMLRVLLGSCSGVLGGCYGDLNKQRVKRTTPTGFQTMSVSLAASLRTR